MGHGIFINDDFMNFFASFPKEDMNEDGIRRQVRFYTARGGVQALLFNMNCMTAVFDSHVMDRYGEDAEILESGDMKFHGKSIAEPRTSMARTIFNWRKLFENVSDPFRIRREACHQAGVEMWLSVRMNDVHWVDRPELPCHGAFWREHPEFRRAAYRDNLDFWNAQAFDYAHAEVRTRMLAFIEELLERGKCDGLELDWMRTPPYFRPSFDRNCSMYLTDMMRQIRKMAIRTKERYGNRIRIGVRLPARPEECHALGLDIFTWCKEELLDAVFPSSYFQTTESMPVELWRNLLPEKITLAPALELNVKSGAPGVPQMITTSELDRGFAAAWLADGADTVYCFNHMSSNPVDGLELQQLNYSLLGNRKLLEKFSRRIPAVYHECLVDGWYDTPALPLQIGRKIESVRLNVGGGTKSCSAKIIFGFSEADALPRIRINTVSASLEPYAVLPPLPALPENAVYHVFKIPDGVLHDGDALIEICSSDEMVIIPFWLEIMLIPFTDGT